MKHTRKNRGRKPYRQSRAVDPSCRCHGGCPHCERGRLRKRREAREELDEARRVYTFANGSSIVVKGMPKSERIYSTQPVTEEARP